MATQHLIIFLKAPRLGLVKTRLAQSLGAAAATAAYGQLVETLLEQLAPLPDVELHFTPDDAAAEILPWLHAGWTARAQGAGDLGERLHAAFQSAFADGAQRVVIIGSDCPAITTGDIHAAWQALATSDVVIGPARDGGYWLIGLRQPLPGLWNGIPWSTERVLRETLARAQADGLRIELLRELADVDTEADWRAFQSGRHEPMPRVNP